LSADLKTRLEKQIPGFEEDLKIIKKLGRDKSRQRNDLGSNEKLISRINRKIEAGNPQGIQLERIVDVSSQVSDSIS